MGQKRRQFSRDFKIEAVALLDRGDKPLPDVARELGVRVDSLRQWKLQAEGRAGLPATDVFPGNGRGTAQQEEIRRLRRELEAVKNERDFLKKAAAYFAKGSR
jgi:transposase-like protein